MKARKWKQRTFRELAEESGIADSFIQRIESGTTGVSLVSVLRLAHVLGLGQLDVAKAMGIHLSAPYIPSERLHPAHRVDGLLAIGVRDVVACLTERRMSQTPGRASDLRGLPLGEIRFLAAIDQLLPQVSGLSAPVIWQAVDAGYVVTYHDVARYVSDRRRARRQTLAEVAKLTDRTPKYIDELERSPSDRLQLIDILKLDSGMGEKGRLFSLCWAAGMFESWIRGFPVFPFCPIPAELTEHERLVAKSYVGLARTDAIVRAARSDERQQLVNTATPLLAAFDPDLSQLNGSS